MADTSIYREGEALTLDAALSSLTSCVEYTCLHTLSVEVAQKFKDLALNSEQHFLPIPVRGLPTGKESGKFISIDVGGTNLRVGFVELLGSSGENEFRTSETRILKSHEKSWPIEEHLKMDKGEDLFSWIGACIAQVITDGYNELDAAQREELVIGITFSFPMDQTQLGEATLLPMGKGFAITTNMNLGKMLLNGYERHREDHIDPKSAMPKLKLMAIANDTISTFISVAYAVKSVPRSRTAMGLIAGTGTNAAIPLDLHHFKESKIAYSASRCIGDLAEARKVVTNTEWSVRPTGDALFKLGMPTQWDKRLDEQLPQQFQGFQPFEYMTSGRYLGELVRLILYDLISAAGIDKLPDFFLRKDAITTAFVAKAALGKDPLGFDKPFRQLPMSSEALIQPICKAVMDRSAALMAAFTVGLLALAEEISLGDDRDGVLRDAGPNEEELVIAYCGSLMSSNPEYCNTCEFWMNELISKSSPSNRGKRVVLKEAVDGGIIGAAVLAATAMAS
ncbi:MAG: hypothetical protein M1820_000889 [Bogoriella megaspora]|nr:MAG: hypothetical protein M1820_000889 [Bogoriella megaspora]